MFTVLMYASQSWRYCFLDRVICLSIFLLPPPNIKMEEPETKTWQRPVNPISPVTEITDIARQRVPAKYLVTVYSDVCFHGFSGAAGSGIQWVMS